jgi:hypothetical protein
VTLNRPHAYDFVLSFRIGNLLLHGLPNIAIIVIDVI